MSRETLFFAQDTHEFRTPWFHFLSAGARVAWIYLKGYAKDNSRQRSPGKCQRLDPAIAAYTWRVTAEEVAELEAAAIKAGELAIEGDFWIVTDRATFVNERTLRRDDRTGADTDNQQAETSTESAECPPVSETHGNSCHETVTVTETVILPSEEDLGAGEEKFEPTEPEQTPGKLSDKDGAPYWEPFSFPMRDVGLCLCRVHEASNAPPPTKKLVDRHVGDNQPCRQLVDAIGWKKAADLFLWCSAHLEGARSWTTIWANYPGYLMQMENGVARVPRNLTPSRPATTESLADKAARRIQMMTGETPNAA